jgi:hypothetical protein
MGQFLMIVMSSNFRQPTILLAICFEEDSPVFTVYTFFFYIFLITLCGLVWRFSITHSLFSAPPTTTLNRSNPSPPPQPTNHSSFIHHSVTRTCMRISCLSVKNISRTEPPTNLGIISSSSARTPPPHNCKRRQAHPCPRHRFVFVHSTTEGGRNVEISKIYGRSFITNYKVCMLLRCLDIILLFLLFFVCVTRKFEAGLCLTRRHCWRLMVIMLINGGRKRWFCSSVIEKEATLHGNTYRSFFMSIWIIMLDLVGGGGGRGEQQQTLIGAEVGEGIGGDNNASLFALCLVTCDRKHKYRLRSI